MERNRWIIVDGFVGNSKSMEIGFWVSVVGNVVAIILNKMEFTYSIQKMKSEQQLSTLYGMQRDLLHLVDDICHDMDGKLSKDYGKIWHEKYEMILCYGTKDAMKIAEYIQNSILEGIDDGISCPLSRLLGAILLLSMQIKYDTTGVKSSPKSWYIGRYTTQKVLKVGNFYDQSREDINGIVDELKLKRFLKIDSTP